jgi:tetratricopeptide (TPR) repeat protein
VGIEIIRSSFANQLEMIIPEKYVRRIFLDDFHPLSPQKIFRATTQSNAVSAPAPEFSKEPKEKRPWLALLVFTTILFGYWIYGHRDAGEQIEEVSGSSRPEHVAANPRLGFDAYQSMLKGHRALEEGTLESFDRALLHYRHALELDPSYVNAYLAMAGAYSAAMEDRSVPEREATEKMALYARKALAIDPGLGQAYRYLGQASSNAGRYSEAADFLQKAVELNPGDVRILHLMGLNLRLQGRPNEAIPYYDRALALDPLSPVVNESRGSLLRDLGQFEEAEKQYRKTLELDPDFELGFWGLGTLYWSKGDPRAAIQWFEEAVRLAPSSDVFRAWQALMQLELMQDELAENTLREAAGTVPVSDSNDAVLIDELLQIYRGKDSTNLQDGREFMLRYWYGGLVDLPRRELLEARYIDALEHYEFRYPGITTANLVIDGGNYRAAIYSAFAMDRLGDRHGAIALLNLVDDYLVGKQRLGIHGFWISDVQVQVIRGNHQESLRLLELAIREGWRNLWRFYLYHDPVITSLGPQPEIESIARSIQSELKTQEIPVPRLTKLTAKH